MKELVKSGKIWTLLSAFIFMMTCGLVVYAATTNGVKFAVDYKKSEKDSLTYTEWNNLMGDMDNIVPKGAIMIFDSASGCPAGWTQWNNSNGKFIMGADSLSSNRTGGANQVKILLENIPAHTHYYKDTVYSETWSGEPESTNFYLSRDYFTKSNEANKYPTDDYQYLDHGVYDVPDPLNIINSRGVIVGSDAGGDVDNYPIFGLRMTSYEVCGNVGDEVVTARKAMRRGAEKTNINGTFGNLAKGQFADKVRTQCYSDEDTMGPINQPAKAGNKPISIQNEYYTVIFCKKN